MKPITIGCQLKYASHVIQVRDTKTNQTINVNIAVNGWTTLLCQTTNVLMMLRKTKHSKHIIVAVFKRKRS